MASLLGRKPKDTYKDLLQVSNANTGVDSVLRPISDGEGTDSAVQISTTGAKIVGALEVTGALTAAITATGSTTARSLSARFGDGISVKDFGAAGTGLVNDTAALVAAFQYGGRVFVPAGTYLIDTPTSGGVPVPDSGGVDVTVTRDTWIVCDPRAVFVGNAARKLDESMIKFQSATTNRADLGTGKSVRWTGGTFDIRNVKNSTSTPVPVEFPPVETGASAVTDGLNIRGSFLADGAQRAGFVNVIVEGVRFIHGTHWQTGGGDSSVFIDGSVQTVVRDCYFQAARDVAVYLSRDSASESIAGDAIVTGCTFVNCIQGVASKRGLMRTVVSANTFKNCGFGVLIVAVTATASDRAVITGNVFEQTSVGVRLEDTNDALVANNLFVLGGHVLADGTKPATYFTSPDFVRLGGASHTLITGNTARGSDPLYAADKVAGVVLDTGVVVAVSDQNTISGNLFDDIGQPVREVSGTVATATRVYNNTIRNSSASVISNADSVVIGYSSTGKGLLISSPTSATSAILFGDTASEQAGAIHYDHTVDEMWFRGNGTIYWRIESSGHFRPNADITPDIGTSARRVRRTYSQELRPGAGAVIWTSGTGTPEGSVTAPVGSLYTDTAGGTTTTLYVKTSGTGSTGWTAK